MSKPEHHERKELCLTRAPYREGRKPTAVRVYTVNKESKYLLVQGVPTVGAKTELVELFGSHGDIKEVRTLDEYPSERFTEVYLINYTRIQSARLAKRRLDDWSFYGGVLHVCYAPEYETVQDTREKMQDRRKTIATKIRQYNRDGTYTTNTIQNKTSSSESVTIVSNESQSTSYPEQNQMNDTFMKLTQDIVQGQKTCYDSAASSMPSVSSYAHANLSDSASIPSSHMNEFAGQSSGLAGNRSTHSGQSFQTGQDTQPSLSQLYLPPPPRHSYLNIPQNNQPGQKYSFAKVPSAQATFPPDFDARLKHIPTIKHCNASDYDHKRDTSTDINEHANEYDEKLNEEVEKTMQEKINDNLKSTDIVVIKNYAKQGPAPKFIPRQMQSKTKSSVKSKDQQQTKTIDKDEISIKLKRNAFILRGMQGPVDPEQEKKAGPELQISSVEKSVKEIRKHVSQLSDRNLTQKPPKKQKMKE